MCIVLNYFASTNIWQDNIDWVTSYFASQRVLNNDPAVWLDGARPTKNALVLSLFVIESESVICKHIKLAKEW
jgi:hypothetical protein